MYHDVKINISFRPALECYITSDKVPLATVPMLQNVSLFLDYIFLDAPERRMFSQMNHEYLIEQLQSNGAESYSNASVRQKLNFSHPTKELVWVIQPDANVVGGANRWVDFTDNGTGPNPYAGNDPLVDAKIQLNTHDRITTRKGAYYNLLQAYHHHTRIPSTGIYLYSFALEPEKHQPSGSINMSRIEGVNLQMTLSTGTSPVRIYPFCINYNVQNGHQKYSHHYNVGKCNGKMFVILLTKKTVNIQMLVEANASATHSNCGNSLRVSTTTFLSKDCKGTQLIAGSNGKSVENWEIRSQVPKSIVGRPTSHHPVTMQGYGKGSTTKCLWARGIVANSVEGLRYSLVPKFSSKTEKYIERWGINAENYVRNGWISI